MCFCHPCPLVFPGGFLLLNQRSRSQEHRPAPCGSARARIFHLCSCGSVRRTQRWKTGHGSCMPKRWQASKAQSSVTHPGHITHSPRTPEYNTSSTCPCLGLSALGHGSLLHSLSITAMYSIETLMMATAAQVGIFMIRQYGVGCHYLHQAIVTACRYFCNACSIS